MVNNSKPDNGRPDNGRPESGRPESGRPESGRSPSGRAENERVLGAGAGLPAPQSAPAPHPTGARRPYVIAVASQKGGVAKTTTTVSLAGALAHQGQDVLAVDLDAQANLTLALGVDSARLHGAISDVLMNSASLHSISRPTGIPGLDLVPASAEMDLAERFLPIRQSYEFILRDAINRCLAAACMPYDYILLDCPPSMGAVTLNALIAAHLLVIPTQPEFFSAHALRAMMLAIRKVRSAHNPALIYRVLITMQDRRNRIHRGLTEQIRATFGDGLFQTIIETDTKLRESAVAGLPITHYKNQSRSASQYEALAHEITTTLAAPPGEIDQEAAPRPGGPLATQRTEAEPHDRR